MIKKTQKFLLPPPRSAALNFQIFLNFFLINESKRGSKASLQKCLYVTRSEDLKRFKFRCKTIQYNKTRWDAESNPEGIKVINLNKSRIASTKVNVEIREALTAALISQIKRYLFIIFFI